MKTARLGALGFLITGFSAVLAGPASAHVTLHSADATQGGSDALVAVRVPNEEDKATTTQVELDLPADTPLLGVLVQPTAGWQFQVTRTTLPKPITTDDGTITDYVSKVVWTGGSIPVGGYQDFNLDVSRLPSVPTVTVKALQTYSNGDIVRWIELPAAAGQPAPTNPAPTLTLAPAPPDASGGSPTTTASASAAPTAALKGVAKTSDVNGAKTTAIVALVVGIVAVLAAVGALVLRRSTPS